MPTRGWPAGTLSVKNKQAVDPINFVTRWESVRRATRKQRINNISLTARGTALGLNISHATSITRPINILLPIRVVPQKLFKECTFYYKKIVRRS